MPARRSWLSLVLAALCCVTGSNLRAATIVFSGTTSDGHAVSATADFAFDVPNQQVAVTLTNTTDATFDAAELFTGIDFSFGGLAPSLVSKSAILRTVAANGTYTDGAAPANNITWSLNALGGGSYTLAFVPDAKHGIIGPPIAGNYSAANNSIKGNMGHNPFAAESAQFQLSVPGLQPDTPVAVTVWRFGSRRQSATATGDPVIPEPRAIVLVLIGSLGIYWQRR